jgi:DNA-binding transcriptional ArsR family regulator
MVVEPDIAMTAALFGDPARAAMLTALLNRPVLSAGQLAIAANISPQTASFHLAKLTSGSLLICSRRGRNQVYCLAGPAVASAIESLAAVSSASAPQERRSDPFRSERMRQLRLARTCYDHLAGVAGVRLHDSLLTLDYLRADGPKKYVLTAKGRTWFSDLGGTTELLRRRSPFARPCVDWSEQRPHLAGRLAAFLLDWFLKEKWIARIHETRAVRITERGEREFERQYGLNLKTVRTST